MITLPKPIKSTIRASEILAVENWWGKLSQDQQQELAPLYDEQFVDQDQMISIYLCGRYVEQDAEEAIDSRFWINQFYEYLVNHEIVIEDCKMHIGGTCSANHAAESALRNARIKQSFRCPEQKASCLMRKLLSYKSGYDFQFYVRFEVDECIENKIG